jgi:hypothetical protein
MPIPHKSRSMNNGWSMSALPPKSVIDANGCRKIFTARFAANRLQLPVKRTKCIATKLRGHRLAFSSQPQSEPGSVKMRIWRSSRYPTVKVGGRGGGRRLSAAPSWQTTAAESRADGITVRQQSRALFQQLLCEQRRPMSGIEG